MRNIINEISDYFYKKKIKTMPYDKIDAEAERQWYIVQTVNYVRGGPYSYAQDRINKVNALALRRYNLANVERNSRPERKRNK